MRTRTLITLLVVGLAACGGGGDDEAGEDPAATARPNAPATAAPAEEPPAAAAATDPPASEPADTVGAEPTDPPATEPPATEPEPTEPPTTTAAPTTTVPAVQALAVTPLTELGGHQLTSAFTADGATVVAVSEHLAPDTGWTSQSIVRVDAAGGIVQEAPLGEYDMIFGVAHGGGHHLALVSSFGDAGSTCSVREIDPASLGLGWPIDLRSDGICGGQVRIEPENPTVAWVGPLDGTLYRVDLATSAVTPVDLGPLLPFGYEAWSSQVLGGHVYPVAVAAYDQVTGEPITAPDGSALPPLLFRVDGATLAVTGPATLPADRVGVVDGALVAKTGDTTGVTIDPATLALTEVDDLAVPTGRTFEGDGTVWSIDEYAAGTLAVSRRDPDTKRIVAAGETPVAWTRDDFVSTDAVALGRDLLVMASKAMWPTDGSDPQLTTWVFRVGAAA